MKIENWKSNSSRLRISGVIIISLLQMRLWLLLHYKLLVSVIGSRVEYYIAFFICNFIKSSLDRSVQKNAYLKKKLRTSFNVISSRLTHLFKYKKNHNMFSAFSTNIQLLCLCNFDKVHFILLVWYQKKCWSTLDYMHYLNAEICMQILYTKKGQNMHKICTIKKPFIFRIYVYFHIINVYVIHILLLVIYI